MSKQGNSLAIGGFIVGALFLLAAAVMIFGAGDYFKHKMRFVIFFDSALNGLNVGAPVKLQGVQIGNIAEISLEMDAATGQIFKPVVIEVDPELLRDFSGREMRPQKNDESRQEKLAQRLIDLGLKARLETQSLLTGLLYVDLNFYVDKPVRLVRVDYKGLTELPSVPTTVDEIRNTADELIKEFRELPLAEMIKNLSETLRETRDLLKSNETKTSLAALSASLIETQKLMLTLNAQVGPLMNNVNGTVMDTRSSLHDLDKDMLPVLKAAEQSLTTANTVLNESRQTLSTVEALASPDSPLGTALLSMRDAARSLKDLTDSLERHPDEIIYGK
ncbi:MAG: MlaD family protein [Methylococcales bacterium]|nr:MlaD family protein [Methylococcales bacterium]